MKQLKSVLLLAAIIISSVTVKAQFIKAELQVSGLTCSMCQLATQKSLKTLSFISEIKPDLNKNLFILTFKPGSSVDLDMIRKKVKDAGFSVNKLVATFNADKLSITNNFHFNYAGTIYHFMDVPTKTLDGNVRLTVISNGFIPAADYKKYASETSYSCYKTGTMGKEKVVHVTI